MEIRLGGHLGEAELAEKNGEAEFRSAVAEHIAINNHIVSKENMKLMIHIRYARKLNVTQKFRTLWNTENAILNTELVFLVFQIV